MKCIILAAVIVNAQQQILLVRKHNTAFFMQVGGKLEPNESAEAALLREVEEETGSTATIQQFIGRFENSKAANEANHLLVSYLYWVELDQVPQIQAEIAELCWLDLAAIPEQALLAPLTKEIVIQWCQQHFSAMA